jgi:hypothetical protein
MIPDWIIHLFGGAGGGGLFALLLTKLFSRRKDAADADKVEAEVIRDYQEATRTSRAAIAAADEQVALIRRQNNELHGILTSIRTETDAKIAEVRAESKAEIQSLRTRNEEQAAALATMAHQLDQRTVDQAEVEWAKKRNVEYEAMKAELTELREKVKEVPHLRAEVARLTTLLEETQREQRLDHEAMRNSLSSGENLNG